jgi:hypothetical protein
METSVSLLGRLAGAPTDDDWRRLHDLYNVGTGAVGHWHMAAPGAFLTSS